MKTTIIALSRQDLIELVEEHYDLLLSEVKLSHRGLNAVVEE